MINTSLLFNKNNDLWFKDESFYHQKKQLSYRSFRNGVIQPEIIESNRLALGLYAEEKYINCSQSLEYTVRGREKKKSNNYKTSDAKVIYIGPLIKCWGHFITDCLSTLWFFIDEQFKTKFSEYKIAYIPIEGFQMKGNYKRMFEILGIELQRFVIVSEPTMFNEVIVPDCSFYDTEKSIIRMFTDEYKHTIDYIKSHYNNNVPKHGDKIYFTNSTYAKTKKAFGLEKIDNYFLSKGFEVIHPERFSLDEQLDLLINCSIFASTDGSCGHNSIFLSDKSKAIIIPRGPDKTGYQECLCYVHDVDFSYIDSTLSIFTPDKKTHVGPFFYYVSEELMSYFGDSVKNYKRYCKDNFRDLNKYIRFGLTLNRTFNSNNVHSQKMLYYLSLRKKSRFLFRVKQFIKNRI